MQRNLCIAQPVVLFTVVLMQQHMLVMLSSHLPPPPTIHNMSQHVCSVDLNLELHSLVFVRQHGLHCHAAYDAQKYRQSTCHVKLYA